MNLYLLRFIVLALESCIEMFMIVRLTRCFQLVHLYEDKKSCCEVNVKMLGLSSFFFFLSPYQKTCLEVIIYFLFILNHIMCVIVFM